MKKSLLWIGQQWFSFASAVAFSAAVVLAILDRPAAAGVLSGLFLVAALLHVLPKLEYLKAFTIETKFKADIAVANEIVEKIRAASISLASATASIAAASTDLSWYGRFSLIMPVIDGLRGLDVQEPAIKRATSVFSQFMAGRVLRSLRAACIARNSRVEESLRAAHSQVWHEFGEDSAEFKAAQARYADFNRRTNIEIDPDVNYAPLFRGTLARLLATVESPEDVKLSKAFEVRLSESFETYLANGEARAFLQKILTIAETDRTSCPDLQAEIWENAGMP